MVGHVTGWMTVFFKITNSLSLGLGVNVLIITWSLVFDEPLFQILAIMIMKVQQTFMSSIPDLGFGGHWKIMVWI